MNIVRTWSPLDLEALKRNYEGIQSAMNAGIEIRSLTGANAYTFAPMTQSPMQGTCPPYLAVNTMEEGRAVRQRGVTLPILVLSYPRPKDVARYVKEMHYNFLAQSLDNMQDYRALSARVIPIFGGLLGVHMKVEMNGDGSNLSYGGKDSPIDDLVLVKSTLGIYCEGIYTTLRSSESEESRIQKVRMLHEIAQKLEDISSKPFAIRHVLIAES